MFYRELPPSETMENYILNYWEFSVKSEDTAAQIYEIFSDGCFNLICYRNEKTKIIRQSLTGISLKSVEVELFAGDTIWGARISPAAAEHFLQSDAALRPPLSEYLIGKANSFDNCSNFAEAITIFEFVLRNFFAEYPRIDLRVSRAVQRLRQTNGLIKIVELADSVGISRRQLERNFRRASGLTIKQYARVCRVRATAINLVEEPKSNWAARAAEVGFSDQAHLCRELNELTGGTPASFAKTIMCVEHGEILK